MAARNRADSNSMFSSSACTSWDKISGSESHQAAFLQGVGTNLERRDTKAQRLAGERSVGRTGHVRLSCARLRHGAPKTCQKPRQGVADESIESVVCGTNAEFTREPRIRVLSRPHLQQLPEISATLNEDILIR
jgi:hypothetical protein